MHAGIIGAALGFVHRDFFCVPLAPGGSAEAFVLGRLRSVDGLQAAGGAVARSEYASTQSGLAGLAAQAETAQAELRQSEGRIRVLDDTKSELEAKVAALTAEIARLASQSNSDSENLRDISTSLSVARDELDQLRDEKTIELANYEASQVEIRHVEAKIRSLEERRIPPCQQE